MADASRPLRLVDPAAPVSDQLHVAICVLTRGICYSRFAFSLANLVGYTIHTLGQRGLQLSLKMEWATYVHVGRQEVLDDVLTDPTITHVFWFDDDMALPKDALIRLLYHRQPIVGANYCTRLKPYAPTAITSIDPPVRCPTLEGQVNVEAVEAAGFGCLLTERRVFDALPQPCFKTYHDGRQWVGEDVDFCRQAKTAGFAILIDHELSNMIQHVGEFSFTLAHARAWTEETAREAAKAVHAGS